MTAQTEVAGLAEELVLLAIPRPQPAPRRPRKRHQHPATALLGLGLVAVTVVMGAAVLTLRSDVVRLQHEISARKLTCADLSHVRLHVRSRTVRCAERGN